VWPKRSKLLLGILAVLGLIQVPSASFASSTIQSAICGQFVAPAITSPPPGSQTNDASIVVQGTGEPSMTVVILLDGQSVSMTLVAPDGSYALEVPLIVGANSLVAHEANPCGTIKESAPAVVERHSNEAPPSEESTLIPEIAAPIFPGLDQTDRPLERPIMSTSSTPGYQKPTIAYPTGKITTHSNRLWVKGKAQPGSVVTIYVNGMSAARTIASDDGNYGVMVTLSEGDNSLQVKSRLGSDGAVSDSLIVTYVKQELTSTAPVKETIEPTTFFLAFSLVIVLGAGWVFVFKIRPPKL
jgi:hypothetical protein